MTLNEAAKFYVGTDQNRYAVVRNSLFTKLWVFVSYTLSIVTSGAIDFIKDGLGILTLSGANTYTGKTIVKRGTLATSTSNRIADASVVEVDSGATFQLGGAETIAGLSGAGTVAIGANNITLSGSGTTDFSGNITNTTGGFTKSGTGSQTLSGTSSITGAFTHNGGTLIISGSLTTNKDMFLCRGTSVSPANCTITGTITQTGQSNDPRAFNIAQDVNQVGTLTITGANISLFAGLFVGDNNSTGSNGTVIVNSGTVSANGPIYLAGPVGTFTINGGTVTTTSFFISGGGNATNNPTPVSVLNLNGGTLNINQVIAVNQSNLIFGVASAGISSTSTINLNGGSLKFNQLTCNTPAAGQTQLNTINFNGGILDFDKGTGRNLPMATPVGATWNFVIKTGGANISVYANILTMVVPFSNDGGNGGLTKIGAGTLAMGNLAHSYNGSTSISAGTITRTVVNAGTSPGTVNGTATFTNTTLSVSFNVAPSVGMTFKFFPGATTQSYASVTLVNAAGRTGTYDSSTSTLTIA